MSDKTVRLDQFRQKRLRETTRARFIDEAIEEVDMLKRHLETIRSGKTKEIDRQITLIQAKLSAASIEGLLDAARAMGKP